MSESVNILLQTSVFPLRRGNRVLLWSEKLVGNRVLLWSEKLVSNRAFYWYDFDRRRVIITWTDRVIEMELPTNVPLSVYLRVVGGIVNRNMLKPSHS